VCLCCVWERSQHFTSHRSPVDQFFNPRIDAAPQKQINDLIAQGRRHDAELLRKMEEQVHAVWFTKGTPREVQYRVGPTMQQTRAKRQVALW
jgi:endoglucanase